MKITNVRVFRVEGGTREGDALYEIRRGGAGYELNEEKIERREEL